MLKKRFENKFFKLILLSALYYFTIYSYKDFFLEQGRIIYFLIVYYIPLLVSTFIFPEGRFFDLLGKIILIPYIIFSFLAPLTRGIVPFFSFIFLFLMVGLSLYFIPSSLLNDPVKLFIFLVFSFGIILVFGERILKVSIKSYEYQSIDVGNRQVELITSLVNKNSIRFVFYSIFFIGFLIINLLDFNQQLTESYSYLSRVVLGSFVTLIAFDRLLVNRDLIKFEIKEFWSRYKLSVKAFLNKSNIGDYDDYLV